MNQQIPITTGDDPWLFGWEQTPAIVSVWAQHSGRALVWRRAGAQVICEREQFRPWLFAASLDDVQRERVALANCGIMYHELEGPEDSYCFLVSANNGKQLERALCAGASQRLGRKITSLYDLPDDYYRVGPVEQYLMATGRVYFRGMAYGDLHRLQFDLETTALDPYQGRIFLIAVHDNRGLAQTLEAPEPSDEAGLIAELCALIREHDPDVIENHNLFGFDMPFLVQRAATLQVPLALGRAGGSRLLERYPDPFARESDTQARYRYSVPGRELVDTLDAVRRHDFVARDLPSHRLKDVARAFGVAAPDRTYLDGAAVYSTYRSDPATVRRYALDDVIEVDALSQRLMGATFALAGMAPRRYERLASAGPAMGILEPMLVRAYLRAGAALPRNAASKSEPEGRHTGGALHLFATGVAQRVVKADIASLYPSLMRTYRIGPHCDQLGVLLHLVDQLTELRLMHKAAARTAEPGSLAAGTHNALQAAMKLIINSAYGYMGAGAMALFADRAAADAVTSRGRAILQQVVVALRERGVALIEADTDGVYFAVPAGWGEAEERALVAEVAGLLPTSIRLEYEGRYQAMVSHEVKNYALLSYDGSLIVRGVALRSSRAEPFGEQFLQRALGHTMRGDVVGLHAAFEQMVADLQARRLTAADVATRVRLSKTPAAYQHTRSTRQEAAYESLLAAGRTEWNVGERVRFYRNRHGQDVWLPDAADDTSRSGTQSGPLLSLDNTPDTRNDYDIEHYLRLLVSSYASRLRKAFAPEDFDQLFRTGTQPGLFDRPVESIQPYWIRAQPRSSE